MTSKFLAQGATVVYELPEGNVQHFGVVASARRSRGGDHQYRVSGLPGRWINGSELTLAPRPDTAI